MDDFDDLLSSSSRALGESPFANPFAQARSNSPDPWANYGQPDQAQTFHDESYTTYPSSSYVAAENSSILDTDVPETPEELQETPEQTPEDAEVARDTPVLEHPSQSPQPLRSPGFRENLSTDDVSSISKTLNKSSDTPSTSAYESRESSPAPVQTKLSIETEQASIPERVAPLTSLTSSSTVPLASNDHFSSPLGYPTSSITQSFAGLALGGESIGGWQDSQEPFRSEGTTVTELAESGAEAADLEPKSSDNANKKSSNVSSGSLPLFVISVDDPQKVGDPIRPYVLYTVHTKTTSPLYNKPSFSVLRRYSDFLWLYEALSMNNPGVFVPPVPEKSPFGRFDNQFVEQRRIALEKCIQKMADHAVLSKDLDLKLFLESDNFALDIKHRKTEMASERGGFISSIGQTITGPRFYEVDDWFDKKKVYLDSLESQLKGLVKSIEAVSKQRIELTTVIGEFAQAVGELSGSELSKQLNQSFTAMSDVETKSQDLQQAQAQADIITFMSIAEEYARVINSVRLAFSSRVRCHAQWQNAEGELRRIKQVHEKTRGQGKMPHDRIGHSLAQLADAERKASVAKNEFESCSKLIKNEMARFEEERIRDFKKSLEEFLEGMIQRQKELISFWENYQEFLLKNFNDAQKRLIVNP